MVGDIKLIRGQLYQVVEETPITLYPAETPEQEKLRKKAGKPAPEIHFKAVRTKLISEPDRVKEGRRNFEAKHGRIR
jgi:hypothetical protein